jgi:hypothetical protein
MGCKLSMMVKSLQMFAYGALSFFIQFSLVKYATL